MRCRCAQCSAPSSPLLHGWPHLQCIQILKQCLHAARLAVSFRWLQERVYDVGSHCASRGHVYHSLWHDKRRLRCQLKKELKAARLFLEVRVSFPCSQTAYRVVRKHVGVSGLTESGALCYCPSAHCLVTGTLEETLQHSCSVELGTPSVQINSQIQEILQLTCNAIGPH